MSESTDKRPRRTIDEFLNTVSDDSKDDYKTALVGKSGFFADKDHNTYFTDSRDYEKDVEDWYVNMRDGKTGVGKKMASKTIQTRLSVVRRYLSTNKVRLDEEFWRSLSRRNRAKVIAQDILPETEILREIIDNIADIKYRSLAYVLKASGIRIAEALRLELEDIHWEEDPIRIHVRAEIAKDDTERDTFIDDEAIKHLEQWLVQRKDYLASLKERYAGVTKANEVKGKSKPKIPSTGLVFPFTLKAFSEAWNLAVDKTSAKHEEIAKRDPKKAEVYRRLADIDTRTGRHKIHAYILKKFFITKLSAAGEAMTGLLVGHDGYLRSNYQAPSLNDKRSFYKKNRHLLYLSMTPEQTAKDLGELRDEVIVSNKEKERLGTRLSNVESMLNEMNADEHIQAENLVEYLHSERKIDISVEDAIKILRNTRSKAELEKLKIALRTGKMKDVREIFG